MGLQLGVEICKGGWLGYWREDEIGVGVGMGMDITAGQVGEFEMCWRWQREVLWGLVLGLQVGFGWKLIFFTGMGRGDRFWTGAEGEDGDGVGVWWGGGWVSRTVGSPSPRVPKGRTSVPCLPGC